MAKLLLIDDDAMVRESLQTSLREAKHEVLVAADGNEGLLLLQEQDVDLIIVDIIMPNKEGIETIIEVRRFLPDIPIIAMSGGGRTSNTQFLDVAQKLGATRTLRKPFSIKELNALIDDCLR